MFACFAGRTEEPGDFMLGAHHYLGITEGLRVSFASLSWPSKLGKAKILTYTLPLTVKTWFHR